MGGFTFSEEKGRKLWWKKYVVVGLGRDEGSGRHPDVT